MPKRSLVVLAALLAGLFGAAVAAASETDGVVLPDPSIAPDTVVSIQLEALMANGMTKGDLGIRQTWAFAHPDNRERTGPLANFTDVIKHSPYALLLDHHRHSITEIQRVQNMVKYRVLMEDHRGRRLRLLWVVEKVREAPFAGCWMTTIVSPPVMVGH